MAFRLRWSRHSPRTAVAIRCIGHTPEVDDLAEDLRRAFPDAPILYISDQRSRSHKWPAGRDVLPITRKKLDDLGLFHARENVGWTCGDYCYYVALEREWEYLWLIEPDVAFVNGATDILVKADTSTVDLIGTRIGQRHPSWPWKERLAKASDFTEVQGVFFPLTRVSRHLAVSLLEARRVISARLAADDTLRVPNDESVVATVALESGVPTLDLKAEHPEIFELWAWAVKFCRPDIEAQGRPLIVHPVYPREEFVKRVVSGMTSAMKDNGMLDSLKHCSPATRQDVFAALGAAVTE